MELTLVLALEGLILALNFICISSKFLHTSIVKRSIGDDVPVLNHMLERSGRLASNNSHPPSKLLDQPLISSSIDYIGRP